MKTINLQLQFKFDQEVLNDDEIKEVMENVMDALETKTKTSSIAPWEGDNFTESITITETFSQQTVTKKIA